MTQPCVFLVLSCCMPCLDWFLSKKFPPRQHFPLLQNFGFQGGNFQKIVFFFNSTVRIKFYLTHNRTLDKLKLVKKRRGIKNVCETQISRNLQHGAAGRSRELRGALMTSSSRSPISNILETCVYFCWWFVGTNRSKLRGFKCFSSRTFFLKKFWPGNDFLADKNHLEMHKIWRNLDKHHSFSLSFDVLWLFHT